MPRKHHKPEEIVAKLRQVDVLVSQGQNIADAIRQIGVSEVACVTNCSTARYSTRCEKPRSSSRAGGATTTRSGRINHWATNHRLPRYSCLRSPRGRLRYAGHAGPTVTPKLTFRLDHPVGADHDPKQTWAWRATSCVPRPSGPLRCFELSLGEKQRREFIAFSGAQPPA